MNRPGTDWLSNFPVREQCLYLDHAAVCPLPRSVAEAMRRRIADQELAGHLRDKLWVDSDLACRHIGAELVGCRPDDISIIKSTSEGLSYIAEGLTWQDGDEILVGSQEFAANVAPWLNLSENGVHVIRFPQHHGEVDLQAVRDRISPRTRLLAVSWVSFFSGWVAPLAELAQLCRDHGVWFVVDAIQGLGVLPMCMESLGLDAVIADSHKWLLGPEGVGIMATSEALRHSMRPVLAGWRNIRRQPGSMFLDQLEFHRDGRRFEAGARNVAGQAGLAAALDLLTTVGQDVIQQRVEQLNRSLTRLLVRRRWRVRSPGSGHQVAGIVAGRPPSGDADSARKALGDRHVVCSSRQGFVRFSPHFYVTSNELAALERIFDKCGL